MLHRKLSVALELAWIAQHLLKFQAELQKPNLETNMKSVEVPGIQLTPKSEP
jgi:hypothetical protein